MFIVFSKDKISSYLVSVGTVALLFVMAFMIKNDYVTEETSSRVNTANYANEIQNSVIE